MELHHQKQLTPIQTSKFKSRTKSGGGGDGGGNKFVGVRQQPSGRWVAEIKDTTQEIRMWLGTFETPDKAARAYDKAACLLRGANTRTNFTATRRPAAGESPLATRIRKLLHHRKLSSNPSLPPPAAIKIPPFPPPSVKTPPFPHSPPPPPAVEAQPAHPQPLQPPTAAASSRTSSRSVLRWRRLRERSTPCSTASRRWAAAEASEFERMKVERQISASLYAMNGVHEYFEAMQDLSSSLPASSLLDPVWDLPPLLHFSGN